jgi:hypothetical protein
MRTLWTLAIAVGAVTGAQAADSTSSTAKAEHAVSSAASSTGHAVGTAARKTGEVATDAAHGAQHGLQKGGAAIATEVDKADKAMHGKSGKSAVADVKAQSDPPATTKPAHATNAASQAR